MVEPPSVDETIQILKGLRERYEQHHKVKILDEAIDAAAKMSDRYIAGRFLPDKAIDLIDEAGAQAALSVMTTPPEIKELEKKIDDLKKEKEKTIKEQDFEKAAALRDTERDLKRQLERAKKEWKETRSLIEPNIGAAEIAQTISRSTGIPLQQLTEQESKRLLKIEDALHQRVIGQDEAIGMISQAIRRSRAGLKDPKRPVGSFMFLGPTGVGKTLLAKALAGFLFGDEAAIIQIDMSEYMEKFNVSRLVGAPPGYVGYEEGGQLSEKVRRKPYCVVLLDEIEKAHPDVFNILLQVLEEGRLTDSFGRKVSFRNALLIMTSNVGAEILRKQGSLGFGAPEAFEDYKTMKVKLLEEVKKVFKPEFLNRLDDVIVFKKLSFEDSGRIVELELSEVRKRLTEKGLSLDIDEDVKAFLIQKGFDPAFGARPLKRAIQRYLEDSLAEELIAGHFKTGVPIHVSVENEHLKFHQEQKVPT